MQCKLREKTRSMSFNEKLEGSSLRAEASRKIATGLSVAGRLKKGCNSSKARDGPRHGVKQSQAPGMGQEC